MFLVMSIRYLTILLMVMPACESLSPSPVALAVDYPDSFGVPIWPSHNPPTVESAALGRLLFFDQRLSRDETLSCSSCHQPSLSFADGRAVSVGIGGAIGLRSSPTLVNVAWRPRPSWFGEREMTLEEQMHVPLFDADPVELGLAGFETQTLAKLNSDPTLLEHLQLWRPDAVALDFELITQAIASYLRTLVADDSPYDHFVANGESAILSEPALRGMELFFSPRLNCARCHREPLFTDNRHHQHPHALPCDTCGLASISGLESDAGVFLTPTLRQIADTAPYMHDGGLTDLDAVVTRYAAGGTADIPGFSISESDRSALIAFLESLTDPGHLDWRPNRSGD